MDDHPPSPDTGKALEDELLKQLRIDATAFRDVSGSHRSANSNSCGGIFVKKIDERGDLVRECDRCGSKAILQRTSGDAAKRS